jgi:two-component system, cell cycle sensor histidine kinase and response regulator CckA
LESNRRESSTSPTLSSIEKREFKPEIHNPRLGVSCGTGGSLKRIFARDRFMLARALTIGKIERRPLALCFLVVAGVAASIGLYQYTHTRLALDNADALERQIQSHHALVRETLNRYQECLISLGLLLNVNEAVTRDDFRRAAESLLERHPEVLGLQWAPLVTAADRAEWEKKVSADFGGPMRIRRRDAEGRDIPAQDQAEYFPILYAEPIATNRAVLGVDAAASPMRGDFARARAEGQLLFSGRLKLVYETDHDAGIAIINPVLGGRDGVKTPRFSGFLLGIFRVRDIFAQPWRFTSGTTLDAMFVDESATAPDRRVLFCYLSGEKNAGKIPTEAEFRMSSAKQVSLAIGGRNWSIYYRSAPSPQAASLLPLAALGLGLGATGLLAAYLAGTIRHTREVQRQVIERTAELVESRRQLDSLMQSLPGMVFRATFQDGLLQILYASEGTLALTGWSAADFTSGIVHFRDLVSNKELERARGIMGAAIITRTQFEIEYRIDARDGTERWLLSRGRGVFALSGTLEFIEGLTIDVTARKLAENERIKLERKLLEGQKFESLGLLAGGIAHDFNNLLTSILGNAGIVRGALAPGHEVDGKLQAIETGANRAAELCRQMLAYAGKGRFIVEPIDISTLTEGLLALLEISVARKARLELVLDRLLPAVIADAMQLRQLVVNLVLNAADAVTDGAGEIVITSGALRATRAVLDAAVGGSALAEGDYVYLEVRDNGSGIAPEILPRIFDPFFTTRFAGRGLGLAAVLGIVHGHHAALGVESALGRGSAFRLLIPASAQRVPKPQPPRAAMARRFHGRALIIDDDESVRLVVSALTESFGLKVTAAADGQSGLNAFSAEPGAFDIVLLDLLMPGLTGEETMAKLRTIQADIPVLIISGFSESDVMQRLSNVRGPFKFLHKPFKRAELEEKIHQLMG